MTFLIHLLVAKGGLTPTSHIKALCVPLDVTLLHTRTPFSVIFDCAG